MAWVYCDCESTECYKDDQNQPIIDTTFDLKELNLENTAILVVLN